MPHNLYCTADDIGLTTGGGIVTHYESMALASLGPAIIIGKAQLKSNIRNSPFSADAALYQQLIQIKESNDIKKFDIAHFYSGSFPATIDWLNAYGTKVAYTCAAHDPAISREEYERLNIPYEYHHLTNPTLRAYYTKCYKAAKLIICPSTNSAMIMRDVFDCKNITIIPHGTNIPAMVADFPIDFVLGYLGQNGPDKGLIYALRAWSHLKLDAKFKLCSDFNTVHWLNNNIGGHQIEVLGRVENVSDFYNQISVYIQPSSTEGFGIPVLEAMAHGRPVICSAGTGAVDLVKDGVNGFIVPIRDPNAIAECILKFKNDPGMIRRMGAAARETAMTCTWDIIMNKYAETLRSL